MSRLDGKVAIVTGAARGIGRAVAAAMAEEGASVVLADVLAPAAEEAAAAIRDAGGAAIGVGADVSDRAEVEALADAAEQAFGVPSVLVCSAGITTAGGAMSFLDVTDEEWDRVMRVNAGGTFLCAQVVARRLVAAQMGGSIVTVTSIGAYRPMMGAPAYHTAKAAISGLTRALAVNLAPYGIRANGLAPGHILTEMTRDMVEDEERAARLLDRIPAQRIGTPDDLVGAAVFLASDDASYMTGQVLHVDGGALVLGWTPATPLVDHGGGS